MKVTRRGTSNGNVRGNSKDRTARKAYLLRVYEADVPGMVRCYRCGCLLDAQSITVDRIKPGAQGGKYVRTNIRPACGACNSATGGALRWHQLRPGLRVAHGCTCIMCREA